MNAPVVAWRVRPRDSNRAWSYHDDPKTAAFYAGDVDGGPYDVEALVVQRSDASDAPAAGEKGGDKGSDKLHTLHRDDVPRVVTIETHPREPAARADATIERVARSICRWHGLDPDSAVAVTEDRVLTEGERAAARPPKGTMLTSHWRLYRRQAADALAARHAISELARPPFPLVDRPRPSETGRGPLSPDEC